MTELITLAPFVLIIGAVLLAFKMIPTRSWDFNYNGHSITIKNYSFHEELYLNGQKVKGTRIEGNFLTNSRHNLPLPDGKTIEIFIDARGFAVQCQAICDNKVIFDSFDRTGNIQQSLSGTRTQTEDAR